MEPVTRNTSHGVTVPCKTHKTFRLVKVKGIDFHARLSNLLVFSSSLSFAVSLILFFGIQAYIWNLKNFLKMVSRNLVQGKDKYFFTNRMSAWNATSVRSVKIVSLTNAHIYCIFLRISRPLDKSR